MADTDTKQKVKPRTIVLSILAVIVLLLWTYLPWWLASPVIVLVLWLSFRWWLTHADHHKLERAKYWASPVSKSAGKVDKWTRVGNRKTGVAAPLDVRKHGSSAAMRRNAKIVRPTTMEGVSRRQQLMLPPTDVAMELCQVGAQRLYASHEDVVTIVGGPRTGKTALIGALIIDHPGAVISTSTRKELYELTHGARRKRGPVYIFNPGGLGGLASTITFDPIRGCDDPAVALARATDMVGSDDGGDKDRKFWNDQASRVLGALLHAAALGKRTMMDIQQWVAEPKQNASDIEKLLRRSVIPAIVINDFRQFIGINDRTQTSITTAMTPALAWLSHPSAREAAAPSNFPFDVRQLIEEHATIYLLGKEEAHTAALVGALTGEIGRQALLIAAEQVGGRLDPSLLMALDEAANICPVALDSWTSHFGGSGITIVAAFQSRLQMVKRWGKVSAGIILNNTAAVVLLGGTKDEEDLRYWSSLADKRDEVTVTRNAQGKVTSKSVRKVDVFTVQQLSSLPQWHVVVFRRNLLPCVGVITPAWKRDALRYPDGRPVARAARAAWAYTNATPAVPPQDSYPLPPEPADEEQPADTNQPAA